MFFYSLYCSIILYTNPFLLKQNACLYVNLPVVSICTGGAQIEFDHFSLLTNARVPVAFISNLTVHKMRSVVDPFSHSSPRIRISLLLFTPSSNSITAFDLWKERKKGEREMWMQHELVCNYWQQSWYSASGLFINTQIHRVQRKWACLQVFFFFKIA